MRRLALVVLLAPALLLAGCLNEFADPHHLRIVSVDLSPERVLSQDVELNVTTTLDNRGGGGTEPVRLVVKAYSEETGFLIAQNEARVGAIAGDTTRAIAILVLVPREGGVRIDVAVFEAELGKERASVTARNLGALEPEVLDTGLRVRDVDFLVRGVVGPGGNGSRVQVQTDLYVTNEGDAASEDLRVQVKAREMSTSLVADVAWMDTGSIPAGETLIRSTNLTVPDGYNYVFEILTWRGNVVVARSEGTVQLAPTFTKPTNQELVTTNPNVNDFLRPTASPTYAGDYAGGAFEPGAGTPAPKVPGFEVAALAAALVVGALVLRRRRA